MNYTRHGIAATALVEANKERAAMLMLQSVYTPRWLAI